MDIYEEIWKLKKEGRISVLATIVQCRGSSPQKEGAKILIRDDGSITGTLGGGCLEAEVIQASLIAMKEGSPKTLDIELTEKEGGLVCGGKVLVYIEPILVDPHLMILGAGHVGRALAIVAKFSGFTVTLIDDREEFACREFIPDADTIIINDFSDPFQGVSLRKDTYIVIATRGHAHDFDAVKSALKTDAQYIGLLGSRRKRALLFNVLSEAGISRESRERIITPVGLSIGSVTPQEIAISIMAQIIQHRRQNVITGLCTYPCSRKIDKNGKDETTSSPRSKPGYPALS